MKALTFLIALLAAVAMPPASAAPDPDLWDYWLPNQPGNTEEIDHRAWDTFLKQYVVQGADSIARVRYRAVAAEGRAPLDRYIDMLASRPVRQLNRAQQRAVWINLYNALTLRVVLDHYPVASIRAIRISPGLFSVGPWGKKLLPIDGETVSLDDIEHRILRPIWRDPRLHYALNCASLGCPDLLAEAFTAANTEGLLERATRGFVNHSRGVTVANDGLEVSSIYVWFASDFGPGDGAVLRHLAAYAGPVLRTAIEAKPRIVGHRYDWSLNDAP